MRTQKRLYKKNGNFYKVNLEREKKKNNEQQQVSTEREGKE